MASDDAPGTATIWERGRRGLYYDDLGLTVRSRASRLEQYAWSEIGRLADGGVKGDGDNPDHWALIIVLHTGREVNVISPRSLPTPEMLAAITQAARCHGIPADVTGILMKGGKPFRSGLYEDPWGQAGLRYWDKERWSPLLPSDFESSRSRKWWIAVPTAGKSAASWSALPRAHGAWPFAADRARRYAVWLALWASLSAALLTVGLLIDLWWDHGAHHKHYSGKGGSYAPLVPFGRYSLCGRSADTI